MKKALILIITILTFTSIQAQIELEQVYNNSSSITLIDGEGYKYYEMDDLNNMCKVYNLDHTLYASIYLEVPDGQYLYDLKYVTNHTFDTDDGLELCYVYYSYDEVNLYYTYTTRIINDDGSEILMVEGALYATIVNVSEDNNNNKLLIYVYDYSAYPYFEETRIYNLSSNLIISDVDNSLPLNAYPVPSNNKIHIPFSLDDNQKAEILIFDVKGQILKTHNISGDKKEFILNTQTFPTGLYLYQIISEGKIINKNKFIISH